METTLFRFRSATVHQAEPAIVEQLAHGLMIERLRSGIPPERRTGLPGQACRIVTELAHGQQREGKQGTVTHRNLHSAGRARTSPGGCRPLARAGADRTSD